MTKKILKHCVGFFFIGVHVMLGFNWFMAAFIFAILGGTSAIIYGHLVPEAKWHLMYSITVIANIVAIYNYLT